jgi:hypothetical protein
MANREPTLVNDLDVLYEAPLAGLYAGLRYSAGLPIYGPDNGSADRSTHRLGPLIAYRFFDRDGALFNQPTLAVVINWYLKHPYRAGQLQSAALPYAAIGFQTSGDFLPLDPPSAAP